MAEPQLTPFDDPTSGSTANPNYSIVGATTDGRTLYKDDGGNFFTKAPGPGGSYAPYSGDWYPPGYARGSTPQHTSAPPPDDTTVHPPPPPGPGPNPNPYGGLQPPGPFTPPPGINLGGPAGISYIPPTPTFTGANAPPAFKAPTADDALNDPGYQFRVSQGRSGLQNWAAAKGTLNDSSTADALIDYNQNAASQEYQNVWARDYGAYGLQRQNWSDTVLNPTMKGYETQAQAGQHQNDMDYANAWNKFLEDYNNFHFNINWATQAA